MDILNEDELREHALNLKFKDVLTFCSISRRHYFTCQKIWFRNANYKLNVEIIQVYIFNTNPVQFLLLYREDDVCKLGLFISSKPIIHIMDIEGDITSIHVFNQNIIIGDAEGFLLFYSLKFSRDYNVSLTEEREIQISEHPIIEINSLDGTIYYLDADRNVYRTLNNRTIQHYMDNVNDVMVRGDKIYFILDDHVIEGDEAIVVENVIDISLTDDFLAIVNEVKPSSLPCLTRSKRPFFPHQQKVVEYFKGEGEKSLMVSYPTGSGKTFVGIGTLECHLDDFPDGSVLYIMPLSIITQTISSIKNEYGDENFDYTQDGSIYYIKFNDHRKNAKVVFTTIQSLRSRSITLNSYLTRNLLFIVDEAHELRLSSNEFGTQQNMKKNTAAAMEFAKKALKILLMSATFMFNNVGDLTIPAAIINRQSVDILKTSDYKELVSLSIEAKKDSRKMDKYKELLKKLFGCKIIFYDFSEEYYNTYFPEQEIIIERIPMTEQEQKSYEHGLVSIEGAEKLARSNAFQVRNREGLLLLESKVNWIKNFVNNHKKSKILFYTEFVETGVKNVVEKLKLQPGTYGVISGTQTSKEREAIRNKYNKGEIKLVFFTSAGSLGLDFKMTDYTIVMQPAWNWSRLQQAIGRGNRYLSHGLQKSNKRSKTVVYILISTTISLKPGKERILSTEEHLMKLSLDKKEEIELTIDILKEFSLDSTFCD